MAEAVTDLRDGALLAAAKYETPFYLIDIDRIRDRAKAVTLAWKAAFPRFKPFYPYKVNPLKAVARAILSSGYGAEVASGSELRRALEDGAPGQDILLSGPVKHDSDMEQTLAVGGQVAVDSLSEIPRLGVLAADQAVPARVLIRMAICYGSYWSRFGLLPDEFVTAYELVSKFNVELTGLSFHVGTKVAHRETFCGVVRMFAPLLRSLIDGERDKPITLDIGGGFTSDGDYTHHQLAHEIAAVLTSAGVSLSNVRLLIEPGRSIVEDHGVLVAKIVSIKHRADTTILLINAGGNLLSGGNSRTHPVSLLSGRSSNGLKKMQIYGPLCVEDDAIGTPFEGDSAAKIGDLVLVARAGAYDIATATPWMTELPPVLGIEGRSMRVIRKLSPYPRD